MSEAQGNAVTTQGAPNPPAGWKEVEGTAILTARDYDLALDVQDTSNLSGVMYTFAEVLPKILADAKASGKHMSTVLKEHPLLYLWWDKLSDLMRYSTIDTKRYGVAYEFAQKARVK